MNLKDLKKEIPYQWRVQSFSKNKPQAQCVAYIDARDVANLLDEVCGQENWSDEYYQVKNTMLCKIGIKIGDQWVFKSDGGSETDIESEKGELSDSFKRAAVKWGVGRFLYNLKIKYVEANSIKSDGIWPYPIDENKKRIWDLTDYLNRRDNRLNQEIIPQNKVNVPSVIEGKEVQEGDINPIMLINCLKCGSPYKYQRAGISKKTGRPYSSFYPCSNQNCKSVPIQSDDAENYLKPEFKKPISFLNKNEPFPQEMPGDISDTY